MIFRKGIPIMLDAFPDTNGLALENMLKNSGRNPLKFILYPFKETRWRIASKAYHFPLEASE
jgi:hypothetical protein